MDCFMWWLKQLNREHMQVFGVFPLPLILTFLNCQRPEMMCKWCQISASASSACATCNWTLQANILENPGVLWRFSTRDEGKNNGTSSDSRSCEIVVATHDPISGMRPVGLHAIYWCNQWESGAFLLDSQVAFVFHTSLSLWFHIKVRI